MLDNHRNTVIGVLVGALIVSAGYPVLAATGGLPGATEDTAPSTVATGEAFNYKITVDDTRQERDGGENVTLETMTYTKEQADSAVVCEASFSLDGDARATGPIQIQVGDQKHSQSLGENSNHRLGQVEAVFSGLQVGPHVVEFTVTHETDFVENPIINGDQTHSVHTCYEVGAEGLLPVP